jgi:hypothetical protein
MESRGVMKQPAAQRHAFPRERIVRRQLHLRKALRDRWFERMRARRGRGGCFSEGGSLIHIVIHAAHPKRLLNVLLQPAASGSPSREWVEVPSLAKSTPSSTRFTSNSTASVSGLPPRNSTGSSTVINCGALAT